ncbi:MAG TPA: histidine kinase [Flavobacteriales bacterium]|nr:histidine kinase [Flavobacteriales bacterium]
MNLSRIRKLWLPGGIAILGSFAALFLYFKQFQDFTSDKIFQFTACFIVSILVFCWSSVVALSMYTPVRFKSVYAVLMTAVLAYLQISLLTGIFGPMIFGTGRNMDFVDDNFVLLLLISFLNISIFSQGYVLLGETKEESSHKARQDEINEMLREAELHKLQQQFQPHFLFNSLNSISALIAMRPEEARTMVMKLSDFLRTTLKRGDEQGVTFQNEIDYLQLYLDIEKVRFGHRLEVNITTTNDVLQAKIPTLLLQPIVENAIKFGLYGTTEKVIITIDAKIQHGTVLITITNPFDREMLPQAGTGFGLNAIKRRLYLLFARNDLLETTTRENTFITTLKTPVAP